MTDTPTTIRATEFSYYDNCWMYVLSDGTITKGRPGDARIPAGLPFTDRMQWGANQLARCRK